MSTEIFYDSDVLPQENESIDLRGQEIICFTSGREKPVNIGMRRTSFGAKPPDTTENGG